MKTISLILLCFTIFVIGCNFNKNKTLGSANNSNYDERKEEIMKSELPSIIHPSLLIELDKLTKNNDTTNQEYRFDYKVVMVYFSQKDNDCYVTMGTTHFYDSQQLKGYIILNGKMIVFYNPDNYCNIGLVNVEKLITEKTAEFPDENSNIALHTTYEPHGKRFRIHNKDSLELVYSGYL